MASINDDNPELSPTSPADDSEDAVFSPVPESEPIPGLNGVPVKCRRIYRISYTHHSEAIMMSRVRCTSSSHSNHIRPLSSRR